MKKIICVLFALIMCISMSVVCFAEETEDMYRLVDQANVLTDSEEASLLAKLDEISEKHQFDLVVMTLDTLDGEDLEDTANILYELYYGYGDTDDGMLFLLVMDTRDWTVSKNGFGLTAFTDAGFDYIFDKISGDLGNDYYADAFTAYADLCDDFLTQAKAGNPYTADNLPKDPFNTTMNLVICLGIGFVVALIVTGVMKGQLKSVRAKYEASDYTKKGSLMINESRDFFLYRTVSRTEKKKDDDSDRGSSGSSRNQSGKF